MNSLNGQNLLTGAITRTVLQSGRGTEGTLAVRIGEAQLANGATTRQSQRSCSGDYEANYNQSSQR